MSNTVSNPVLVEVTRGSVVESLHRGSIAILGADGGIVLALGDVDTPVLPRSAVKLMQAIPLVESGAADAFGLDQRELAIACASHSGSPLHVETVRGLLSKAHVAESLLACGAHWPLDEREARALDRAGKRPQPIHNNCSGKHAGMLATAKHLGIEPKGYERIEHPVQIEIRRVIAEVCGVTLDTNAMGIDGCSVPNWGVPLTALARGFARLGAGEGLSPAGAAACKRLMDACFAAPILVAGEGRFDTIAMQALGPSLFVKGGAEGVHCAALPELGLGLALKIDDGTKRGSEAVMAELVAALFPQARHALEEKFLPEIRTWHGAPVGAVRAASGLHATLASLSNRLAAASSPR